MAPAQPTRAVHLRPAAELAERVLLPGDPQRALAVAQDLLDAPKMFNHARGLWGYSGLAADGELLTVQSTGMGGPSAAIVCEELIALGARRLVRIGTCGALARELELGSVLAVTGVVPEDGTSAALGADGALVPDERLLRRLVEAGATPAKVATTDLFYDARRGLSARWAAAGAVAVEMEASTVLRVAQLRGAKAACVLAVSDLPSAAGTRRANAAELEAFGLRIGRIGYAALRSR